MSRESGSDMGRGKLGMGGIITFSCRTTRERLSVGFLATHVVNGALDE